MYINESNAKPILNNHFGVSLGLDCKNSIVEILNFSLKNSFGGFMNHKSDQFEFKLTLSQIAQALNRRPLGIYTDSTTKIVGKITSYLPFFGKHPVDISVYGDLHFPKKLFPSPFPSWGENSSTKTNESNRTLCFYGTD